MSPDPVDVALARYRNRGDPKALAAIYDWTASELLRVAIHLTECPTEAEDLVQATFLTVIEKVQSYEPSRPALPWLMGILGNLVRRRRERAERVLRHERLVKPVARDPLAHAERLELTRAVDDAIERLPEVYRPVLRLHLGHELNAAQIAHALGRPPGTVRTQIVRGLEMLRKALPAGFAVLAAAWLTPARGLAAIREVVVTRAGLAARKSALLGGAVVVKKISICLVVLFALGLLWLGRALGNGVDATASEQLARAPGTESRSSTSARQPMPVRLPSRAWHEPPTRAAKTKSATLVVSLVRGRDREPATGVGVRVTPIGRDLVLDEHHGRADAGGAVRFSDLPAGTFDVATDRGGGRRVELEAGTEKRVTLALPAGIDIAGRVVDSLGRPVGHAEIWLSEGAGRLYSGQAVATADASGCFVLRAVPIRHVRFVAARAPGYVASCRQRILPPKAGKTRVEVVLELPASSGTLSGRVVDTASRPIAGAHVRLGNAIELDSSVCERSSQGGPPPEHAIADEHGVIEMPSLPAGRHAVLVRANGFAPWFEYVDIARGSRTQQTFRMRRGVALAGTVRDTRGRLVEGAKVRAYGYSTFASASATAGRDGTFRVAGLEPSIIQVKVSLDGYREVRHVLTPGNQEVITWDPVLEPELVLRGRLVDAGGTPIEAAWVSLRGASQNPGTRTTDGDGRFAFSGLEDRDYTLYVCHPAPGPRSRWGPFRACDWLGPVRPSGKELVVRLPESLPAGVHASGRVVAAGGAPFAGARIQVHQLDAGGRRFAQFPAPGATDATGWFRIGPLPAGSYDFVVWKPADESPKLTVSGVELRADRDLGVLEMPVGGRLDVRASSTSPELVGRTSCEIHDANGSFVDIAKLRDGRAAVTLAPGEYRLSLFGQGFVWIHRRFTIRAGQTTTLELRLRPGVQRQLVFPVPRTPGWDDVRSFQVEVVSADGTVHIEDSVESVRYWPHPWWPSLAPGSYAIRVKTDRGRTLAGAFVVEDLLPRLAPIRIPLR